MAGMAQKIVKLLRIGPYGYNSSAAVVYIKRDQKVGFIACIISGEYPNPDATEHAVNCL